MRVQVQCDVDMRVQVQCDADAVMRVAAGGAVAGGCAPA